MKNPALAILITALLFPAAFAQQNPDRDGNGFVDPAEALLAGGHAVRDGLSWAWNRLESAGMVVSDELTEATMAFEQGVRDVRHMRPDLAGEYLKIVKKDDRVVLVYCDSRLRNSGRIIGRRGRQSCEKLHENKSFKAAELDSCLDTLQVEDKGPGLSLRRTLRKAARSEYDHDKFAMAYPVSSFKGYLAACHADLEARNKRPGRPVATAPARARPAPAEEFRPVEPQAGPAAQEQSDTL